MSESLLTKVARFPILRPVGDLNWKQLDRILRDTRYRVFRLANLAISEAYLSFHAFRTGQSESFTPAKISELNRRLRAMLREEGVAESELDFFSETGALPGTVVYALSHYKIRALTSKSKWSDVTRGKAALPTFRLNMSIPIRCDLLDKHRRLERTDSGDVELDLMVCTRPYPRVVLQTGSIGDGMRAILDRLLDNPDQSPDGYRQRCFEIKHDERTNRWWLHVTYSFPPEPSPSLSPERVVGVDLGFSCPLYVALSNGHARMGRRQFAALGARVQSLQRQIIARRRSILSGGKSNLTRTTARAGHGRKRRIRAIDQLDGRINSAYTTLNNQLSAAVIEFAKNHGAGVIQMENLDGLREQLSGSFLGARWRYHQLQQFIENKAAEAGIKVRRVNPRFTSRRCSACGHIHADFSRARRDAMSREGFVARFQCPACGYTADPDYNAARNLATLDIEKIIAEQCKRQGIAPGTTEPSLTEKSEAANEKRR